MGIFETDGDVLQPKIGDSAFLLRHHTNYES